MEMKHAVPIWLVIFTGKRSQTERWKWLRRKLILAKYCGLCSCRMMENKKVKRIMTSLWFCSNFSSKVIFQIKSAAPPDGTFLLWFSVEIVNMGISSWAEYLCQNSSAERCLKHEQNSQSLLSTSWGKSHPCSWHFKVITPALSIESTDMPLFMKLPRDRQRCGPGGFA